MRLGDAPFGEVIRQLRTNLGLSSGAAAKKAGVDPNAWRRMENGDITDPHLSTVLKVLRSLGAAVEYSVTVKLPEQLKTDDADIHS